MVGKFLFQGLQGYFAAAQLLLEGGKCEKLFRLFQIKILLLHTEIGQVHKLVMHLGVLQGVSLRAEPGKALLIDKGLQGIDGEDKHIDPHIKLVPIEEQRVLQVLLDDNWLTEHNILYFGDEFDATASR